jgi:hypothetical protein
MDAEAEQRIARLERVVGALLKTVGHLQDALACLCVNVDEDPPLIGEKPVTAAQPAKPH